MAFPITSRFERLERLESLRFRHATTSIMLAAFDPQCAVNAMVREATREGFARGWAERSSALRREVLIASQAPAPKMGRPPFTPAQREAAELLAVRRGVTANPVPSVGQALRRFRARAGWTRERLAREVQVNVLGVRTWETDRGQPNPARLAMLIALVPELRGPINVDRITSSRARRRFIAVLPDPWSAWRATRPFNANPMRLQAIRPPRAQVVKQLVARETLGLFEGLVQRLIKGRPTR